MIDEMFLQHALKQAFIHPIICSDNRLSVCFDNLSQTLKISDAYCLKLIPTTLSTNKIRPLFKAIKPTITPRHNQFLYQEYDLYKHDLSENIIIPENYEDLPQIKEILDLVTVSRQSAQKKKVVAAIFPPTFTQQLKLIKSQYAEDLTHFETILNQNQKAVNICLLNDFYEAYTKYMKYFHFSNFVFWINRKQMIYYLNEAAQLQKSNQKLASDFCETHQFYGQKHRLTQKTANKCTQILSDLLALMQKMTHEPQLFSIVQDLFIGQNKYFQSLKEYRYRYKIDNFSQINTLRSNMQKLFNQYAYLCYIDGVRYAFENKFLNDAPCPKNPPLPTVSPQNEIQQIKKIISDSKKIDSSNGKIGKILMNALSKYDQIRTVLFSALK